MKESPVAFKNFITQEFVPKTVYEKYGASAVQFLHKNIVLGAEVFREIAKAETSANAVVIINNWYRGGTNQECGYRDPDTDTGAFRSAHKRGQAIDFHVKYGSKFMTGAEMRAMVMKRWDDLKSYFTTMEDDTDTWVHLDCRWQLSDYSKSPIIVPFK